MFGNKKLMIIKQKTKSSVGWFQRLGMAEVVLEVVTGKDIGG